MVGWSRQAEVDLSGYLTSGGNFKTALLEIASAYLSGNNFKVSLQEVVSSYLSGSGNLKISIEEVASVFETEGIPIKIVNSSIMMPTDIQGSTIMVPVDIQAQYITLDVDIANTERTLSGEIDTSTDTSPQTVVTPTSGKKISTRGVFLFSDSTSGEIEARFPSSGKLLAKIYCTRYYNASLPEVKFEGDVDESIQISWSGVSSGAKIFWVIKYKEV